MPHFVSSTRTLSPNFLLQFGSREPDPPKHKDRLAKLKAEVDGFPKPADRHVTGPCVWLLRARNMQEVARVERDWATQELRFHYLGAAFQNADEFAELVAGLEAIKSEGATLAMNPGNVKLATK